MRRSDQDKSNGCALLAFRVGLEVQSAARSVGASRSDQDKSNGCALLAFRVGLEVQSAAIRAIAQARRSGAVVEDVAQMAAALGAAEFGAHHAMAGVRGGLHRAGLGIPEAGPTGAAFKLVLGVEQFGAAAGTLELAGALFVIEGA